MKKIALLISSALLAACGGSNSDNGGTTTTPSSTLPHVIEGQLSALDRISGAATVGRYNVDLSYLATSRSVVTLDNLQLGMVLTLETDGDKTVQNVIYDELLVAGVTSVDVTKQQLVIAGKTVLAQGAKLEAGLTISNALIGKVVEVSGFTLDQDTIQATYIEIDDDAEHTRSIELTGVISELDSTAKTFKLGAMSVNYKDALEMPHQLENGQWIDVEGTLVDNVIHATEIELEDKADDYNDDDRLEFEGLVTHVSLDETTGRATKVLLNGTRTIAIPASGVEFEDFPIVNNQAQIKANMLIEVEGVWQNGVMQASSVECESGGCVDGSTSPSIPDALKNEFELEGWASFDATTHIVTLNGVEFVTTQSTQWEDLSPAQWVGNKWVSLSGSMKRDDVAASTHQVWEVEHEFLPENDLSLQGVVADDASLWGYSATDASLEQFIGQYVDVECQYVPGNGEVAGTLSMCRLDD
ncbi:hypothetical protein HGP28_13260 [Vibrio sp. SM6]|uniref:DUF5666 domain-containing protein n=1 Tax=Vibrio agarilyticus TaxID=2726741 RepID=A0A7X8TS92_9VIBR|nr:DUF5666 domain-containing protein [Vibrio agarilyticus]NLS13859.1 hypothetical protein [Vibrio agarilyticus]